MKCCNGGFCSAPDLECSQDNECIQCGLLGHPACTDIMDAACYRGLRNSGGICVAQCEAGSSLPDGSCSSPSLGSPGRKGNLASKKESKGARREF